MNRCFSFLEIVQVLTKMRRPKLKDRKAVVSKLYLELKQIQSKKRNNTDTNYGFRKDFVKEKQVIYSWLTYDIVRVAIPLNVCGHRRWTHTRWGASLVNDPRVLVTGEARVRAVDIHYYQHNTNQKLTTLQHAQ